jgi:hypothetical protein
MSETMVYFSAAGRQARSAERNARREGTLLNGCCLPHVHEHAEANAQKNDGLALTDENHAGRLARACT